MPKQMPAMAPIERPEHECRVFDLFGENVVKGVVGEGDVVDAEEREVLSVEEYEGRGEVVAHGTLKTMGVGARPKGPHVVVVERQMGGRGWGLRFVRVRKVDRGLNGWDPDIEKDWMIVLGAEMEDFEDVDGMMDVILF